MATAVPTTELIAVNEMLTAIGTTPVNSLAVSGLTDAAIALDTLRTISKSVQTTGWWFNKDQNVTYTPSGGNITVPATILTIRPTFGTSTAAPETVAFVQRDNLLWNKDTNSTTFASSVRADTTKELEFENLPESARWYITVRAARIFQTKVLGDETLGVFTEQIEMEAWAALEGNDVESTPATSLYMKRARRVGAQVRPDPVTGGTQRSRRQ